MTSSRREELKAAAHKAFLDYESKLCANLRVPEGDDWYRHLPENTSGDRMFAEWQRLVRESRLAGN
jgi:hypothetical protein